jgi:hypothetical protein
MANPISGVSQVEIAEREAHWQSLHELRDPADHAFKRHRSRKGKAQQNRFVGTEVQQVQTVGAETACGAAGWDVYPAANSRFRNRITQPRGRETFL